MKTIEEVYYELKHIKETAPENDDWDNGYIEGINEAMGMLQHLLVHD